MDRGIYAAASGGLFEARRLQNVAHNLANVNTVGFKAARMVGRQQEFADTLAGAIESTTPGASDDHDRIPGVVDITTQTDFSQGPVQYTDNPLHVAHTDPSLFFVVNGPEGDEYTRAGNFTLDANSTLVTPDGQPVLGQGGPIAIPNGVPSISSSGAVLADGQVVGQLRTVRIDQPNGLTRKEGVRFVLDGGAQATDAPTQLVPRSVEMPNVGVVESMVEMIAAQRSFESYTKTLKTIDEINERAVRSAGSSG